MDEIKKIQELIERNLGKTPLIIIGNKSDLKSEREVSESELQEFAKLCGCQYFEVSANTGKNVDLAFNAAVRVALINKKMLVNEDDKMNISRMVARIEKAVNSKIPIGHDLLVGVARTEVSEMIRKLSALEDPKVIKAYLVELKKQIGEDKSNVALAMVTTFLREHESEMFHKKSFAVKIGDVSYLDKLEARKSETNPHLASGSSSDKAEVKKTITEEVTLPRLMQSQKDEIRSMVERFQDIPEQKKPFWAALAVKKEVLVESELTKVKTMVNSISRPDFAKAYRAEFSRAAENLDKNSPAHKAIESVIRKLDAREAELRVSLAPKKSQ